MVNDAAVPASRFYELRSGDGASLPSSPSLVACSTLAELTRACSPSAQSSSLPSRRASTSSSSSSEGERASRLSPEAQVRGPRVLQCHRAVTSSAVRRSAEWARLSMHKGEGGVTSELRRPKRPAGEESEGERRRLSKRESGCRDGESVRPQRARLEGGAGERPRTMKRHEQQLVE